MKRFLPVVLTGLLFASPLVLAEEAAGQAAPEGTETKAPGEAAAPAEGMKMEPGMMGEQGAAGQGEGMAMEPGMQQPGKEGCRMGKGGMKGMMMQGGGMGKGGMMGQGGGMTQEQFRELSGRLKVLEARLAKIENMLEQLLQQ